MGGGCVVELAQGHSGSGDGLLRPGFDLQVHVAELSQIDDHAFADIPAAHCTTGAPRDQRNALFGRPADQADEIGLIPGEADRSRENSVNPGSLGVGGSSAGIVPVLALDVGRRQHRPKLTILSPWLSFLALNSFISMWIAGWATSGTSGTADLCPIRATTIPLLPCTSPGQP